jgi:ABC transporter DrrB family efflux protein
MSTTSATATTTFGPGEPTAAPLTPATSGSRLAWAIRDGLTVTKRNVRQMTRIPDQVVFSTIQPIMFVVLFAYVFGSAIPLPGGGDYKEFLMAGIFAQMAAFASAQTCVAMASDMTKGIVDRFRSLPMARSAVLAGRTSADMVNLAFQFVVMSITGLLVGWSINDGFARAVAAYALLMLFGFAMSWIGAWMGLSVNSVEAANTVGFIWLFPLTFVSNAFVPTTNMPAWLQTVAEWNPVSSVVAAARELFGNPNPFSTDSLPGEHPILMSLIWSAVILAIFVPLAIRKYRSATSR